MQKHSYLTTRSINNHPIGSKCFVLKVCGGQRIVVEYPDGDVVEFRKPEEFSFLEEDFISLFEGPVAENKDGSLIMPLNETIKGYHEELKEYHKLLNDSNYEGRQD